MSEQEEIIIDKKNAVSATNEQIVRFSRYSTEYVYATPKGEELSISVAKTMNLLDAQPNPSDDDFCDICIGENELANLINVRSKNLHQEIVKGNFLSELRTSAFVSQKKNNKGEIVYAEILNAISYVKYEDGKLYVRVRKKEIMKTKIQMLQDHTWRELNIPIFKIRQSTFSLETYLENYNFISVLLKRQLKTICEKTDIEIDWKNVTTNKRGDNAEYVIMSVRRKEIEYFPLGGKTEEEHENGEYYKDEELNREFSEYLRLINVTEKSRIAAYKKRLEECVKDTLPVEKGFNTDIALRIIRRAVRGGKDGIYRDFTSIKPEEISNYCSNNEREKKNTRLQELEKYYMNILFFHIFQ